MSRKKANTPSKPARPCAPRGRNMELIRRRNIKLLQRYHHLTEVKRIRGDDVLHMLSTEEFYISEQRIWRIVNQNLDILDKIKAGEMVDILNDKI